MNANDYQNLIYPLFRDLFLGEEVNLEWIAITGAPNYYSPRVDLSVGPYSIEDGGNKIEDYDSLLRNRQISDLIKELYNAHLENLQHFWMDEIPIPPYDEIIARNQNARCFMAVEIENTSTRKHIMGSIVNAASLGRIGLGVGFRPNVTKTFVRILNYLAFLKRVGKTTYDTTNFLIVSKEQLENILREIVECNSLDS
jgi:hypothetical protein